MKLKIFSYLSAQRKALGPAAPETDVLSLFDPAFLPPAPNALAGELQQLASQYHAWRDGLADYDFAGFENAARPLFLLPIQARRLAVHYPALLALRHRALQARNAAELEVPPALLTAYEEARAALDDADFLRLRHWLSRVDIAAPPPCAADPLRARHTDAAWEMLAPRLRKFPAFQSAPDTVFCLSQWPRGNSFILRTELFMEFASILFETLAWHLEQRPLVNPRFPEFVAERLLGAYLAAKLYANPLLATAELPLLRAVPPTAPTALPSGFNAAGYILINLDIEPGMPAREHYLSLGWREGREWDLP